MQAIRDHYEVSNRFGAKEVLAFLLNENGGLLNFQKLGRLFRGSERLVDDSRLPEAVFTAQENGIAS